MKTKVKYFFKKKFFNKRKLPKLNEFPENLRCSDINGAMHKLLVGEYLTGEKASVNKNALVCIY